MATHRSKQSPSLTALLKQIILQKLSYGKIVTAEFPVTKYPITIKDIPGIPIPIAGASTFINPLVGTDRYLRTVSWSPSAGLSFKIRISLMFR